MGIELVNDGLEPACDATERVMCRALEEGLSYKVTMGNNLTLTPAEMDKALDIIEEFLTEVSRG